MHSVSRIFSVHWLWFLVRKKFPSIFREFSTNFPASNFNKCKSFKFLNFQQFSDSFRSIFQIFSLEILKTASLIFLNFIFLQFQFLKNNIQIFLHRTRRINSNPQHCTKKFSHPVMINNKNSPTIYRFSQFKSLRRQTAWKLNLKQSSFQLANTFHGLPACLTQLTNHPRNW